MPIHLLIPSLLGPWPDSRLPHSLPALPVLEKLLARANQRPAPIDYSRTLFTLLEIPFLLHGGLPTAKLCWGADFDQSAPANLLHADPVYLKPDMNNVQLFRPDNLTMQQAQAYAEVFNDCYKNHGFSMRLATANRWYICAPQAFETPAASLDQVTGRNLRTFLPAGKQSSEWNRLFTEIQMLFHDLSVNQARQAAGEVPVSGVWLSGGGDPPAAGRHGIEAVQGDDPLLQGLTIHADLSHIDEILPADGSILVVRQGCHEAWLAMDFPAWLDAAQQIEKSLSRWIQEANQVILYPCNGHAWHWRPNSKYRLWRKKHGLAHYLLTGDR